jgi:hypothetical protein
MGLTLGSYLINKDARFTRNPDYIFRKVVEEFILVPIHQDVADMECIYTLNPVGAFIWGQLEKDLNVKELRASMIEAYDADPEVIEEDLVRFLEEMLSIGAIKRK